MIRKIHPAIVCICISAVSSALGASFQGLGDLSGGSIISSASGVSADGSVVVGYGYTASGQQAFRWTPTGGMVSLGNLSSGGTYMTSTATKVSADGATIAGYGATSSTTLAFRWTQSTGMTYLGDLPGGDTYSRALGISADGSVIVGDSRSTLSAAYSTSIKGKEAFRWTSTNGMVGMGTFEVEALYYSTAMNISRDGSVIVGIGSANNCTTAMRWTQSGGMVDLGDLAGGNYDGWASATNSDGSVVAGTSSVVSGATSFRWTQSGGMLDTGNLSGKNTTYPYAMTADGSVVVGASSTSWSSSTRLAYIWDSTHGIRNLKDVLTNEYGLDLTGWTLLSANDISSNGNVIVGEGIDPSGYTEAFLVMLVPEPAIVIQLGLAAMLLGLFGIRRFCQRD